MKQKFEVNGMSCAACSASVERMVSAINGVSKVEVNLMQKLMICEYDEKITSADEIVATVDKNFAITVKKNEGLDGVRVVAVYDSPIPTPVMAGDKIGKLVAQKNGKEIASADLIAQNTVKRVQFFRRIWYNIMVLIGVIK